MKQLLSVLALGLWSLQSTAAADRTVTCPSIDGVETLLDSPGVFVGEMHGSVESPGFLSALACHAARAGRHVVVALEYAADDQPVLDQFLRTRDAAKSTSMLTSTRYWTENRDGRASAAMRDALVEMRKLSRAGYPLKLIAYDLGGVHPAERDSKSAGVIRQLHNGEDSAAYWIVFGGNIHARKTKGLPFINAPAGSDDYEPLGYLIRDWGLIHLNVSYRGGTSWGCTGPSPDDCRVLELGPTCNKDCPARPVVRLQANDPAYDGVYDVGRLTVSGPLARRAIK